MPVGAQLPHQREQPVGFARRERGGRLVQDQDLRVRVQRAGDLHQLLLGDRQAADQGVRGERRAEPLQHRAAAVAHGAAVDAAAAMRLGAEIDVLRHRQVRRECQLLVDDGDAVPLGRDRVGDGHGLAVDQQLAAGVGLVRAGQNLHQRGLAGAVLAHQRQHLAAPCLEADVVERLDPGEGLGNSAHLEPGHGLRAGGVAWYVGGGPGCRCGVAVQLTLPDAAAARGRHQGR